MENMIQRDRLTKDIEEQISESQEGIPLLNRHLTSALFFSKLSASKARPVREKLNFIVASAERRAHLLAQLKENLQSYRQPV